MQRFLKGLVAAIGKFGRRSAPRPEKRVQLNVETMEDRLVPSTVLPKAAVPLTVPATMPALAAPLGPRDMATGQQPVAEPEQCVHGYKWRPYPRPISGLSQGVAAVQDQALGTFLKVDGTPGEDGVKAHRPKMAQRSEPLVVQQAHLPQVAQAGHLLVGGDESRTASASCDGHIVVQVPEGPLPTDFTINYVNVSH
jgi:hypothetical protein